MAESNAHNDPFYEAAALSGLHVIGPSFLEPPIESFDAQLALSPASAHDAPPLIDAARPLIVHVMSANAQREWRALLEATWPGPSFTCSPIDRLASESKRAFEQRLIDHKRKQAFIAHLQNYIKHADRKYGTHEYPHSMDSTLLSHMDDYSLLCVCRSVKFPFIFEYKKPNHNEHGQPIVWKYCMRGIDNSRALYHICSAYHRVLKGHRPCLLPAGPEWAIMRKMDYLSAMVLFLTMLGVNFLPLFKPRDGHGNRKGRKRNREDEAAQLPRSLPQSPEAAPRVPCISITNPADLPTHPFTLPLPNITQSPNLFSSLLFQPTLSPLFPLSSTCSPITVAGPPEKLRGFSGSYSLSGFVSHSPVSLGPTGSPGCLGHAYSQAYLALMNNAVDHEKRASTPFSAFSSCPSSPASEPWNDTHNQHHEHKHHQQQQQEAND